MPLWVKSGKTRLEHLLSAFDLIPDEQADTRAAQPSAKTANQHPVRSVRWGRTGKVRVLASVKLVVHRERQHLIALIDGLARHRSDCRRHAREADVRRPEIDIFVFADDRAFPGQACSTPPPIVQPQRSDSAAVTCPGAAPPEFRSKVVWPKAGPAFA